MKVFIGALCALLSALCVSSFPMPGHSVPSQCGDPTFACQDLQSARLCGVVKTCIHDIWATMTVPDDNDEVCDICKEMVKEARDQLLSNMTQEEIKEVFEGSCKLLPVKIIAEGCIKIVDEIIPQLVEMLASRMDPTMVCTVSGMCFASKNGPSAENHIYNFFKSLLISHKTDQCAECTTMMTDVQAFLKSTPEDDVKKYLETFCHEKMPAYLCNIVVKTYFPEIYKFLLSTTPAKLCSSVGICPLKCELHKSSESKVNDELTCEFCYHLVEHVKDLITANTTVEEFKSALLNFCNVTGSFSAKCTELVNDYYDMLFNYIRKIDSKGMCTLIGLCNNDSCSQIPLVKVFPALEVRRKVPLIKLRPAERIPNLERIPLVRLIPAHIFSKKEHIESNDIFQSQLPIELITQPLSVFQKDTNCALCKAFSFYLEKDLAGDRSKAGIRRAISGVCEGGMIDYSEECGRIAARYSMKIQVALAKGATFDDLCPLLKACPLSEETSGGLNVRVVSSLKDNPFCDLCKEAMNEVEKQLSDPATKQKLENLLGQVCNYLPQSLRSDCTNFINSNIDAVIDILEQELKPDTVCPAIGLCPASSMAPVSVRVKTLECDVCKDVVASFRQKLEDPSSKVIVQTFLEEACIRLPGSLASECKTFVDQNIDMILNILIQEIDPQGVCSLLTICKASLKKPEPVNDVECDLCKEVAAKLIDMVKDKKTVEEIEQALDTVCSYLPSSIATKCENFVNEYTPTLITLLTQNITPDELCALLNVCPASLKKPKPVNDVECDLCKEVATKLIDMVKDKKTVEEIEHALDTVCSYLPSSIATKCENFVNEYTPTLITLLTQEITPEELCALLNVCPAVKKVKNVECDLCQQVIGQVEVLIKDSRTEAEIQNALDKVCSYLPSSISAKCENFVNTYTKTIIILLVDELDPTMVCAALNLCPATVKKVKIEVKDAECEICTKVVEVLGTLIKDADTEEKIKKALDGVCTYLPSPISSQCKNFVDQYVNLLIDMIVEEIPPGQICAALTMCPSFTVKVKTPKVKDIECDLCKEVVGKVEDMIKDKKTEDEIKHALDTVCSYLPSSLSAKCTAFVDQYTELLITLLTQELDPAMICASLNVCPASEQYPKWRAKAQDVECESCQYALHFVQEQLMNPDTQAELKNLLKRVCDILPEAYSQNCEAFVDEYGASLLTLVAQEIDPNTMCFELQMCSNKTSLLKSAPQVPLGPFSLTKCSVCTTVVDYVGKLLEEDDVDKEITRLVEKVCTVVPQTFKAQCSTVLETYGPYILEMIGQMADSKQICQDIDMCARNPHQVHLLGGSKCTFGPSYWCQSSAHAAACKAEMYCSTYVTK